MSRWGARWALLMLSAAGLGWAEGWPSVQTSDGEPPGASRDSGPATAERLETRRTLIDLYARRQNRPLWSRAGAVTPQARAVVGVLRGCATYGLRPEDYRAEPLAGELDALLATPSFTAAQWMAFDVALSDAALHLLHDLHFGRIEPRAAGFDMPPRRESFDVAQYLEELATRADAGAVLAEVEPGYLHYRLLQQSLARYRELARTPGLTELPALARRSVLPGEAYAGAPALRTLLAALGDLPRGQAARSDPVLDTDLVTALKQFQYLHGLREDGTLGRGTYAALTVPLAQRVRQIELTLERWRWVPALESPTLIVNIPQFRLYFFRSAIDHEADMLRMNVIVGREYPRLHTPVFSSDMNAVIFRPYWEVPPTIARRELLPLALRNPQYLESQHLELAADGSDTSVPLAPSPANLEALEAGTLRLRQRPGPDNALGLIKFVLPNSYDVYLHSTPAPRLFDEPRRDFSHGCIRVADPVALAAEVLRGTPGDWTADKVRAAMNGDRTFRVKLAQPVHVLILYGTAVATEDGAVHFLEDIYGYDRRLEGLLGLTPVARGF
jgi:L,D-transpeptidase YcbB